MEGVRLLFTHEYKVVSFTPRSFAVLDIVWEDDKASLIYTESSSGIYACGQDGSYDLLQANRKPAWWKQEKESEQICTDF